MYLLSPNQRERFRGQVFSEENNFKDPAEIARSGQKHRNQEAGYHSACCALHTDYSLYLTVLDS